MEIPSIDSINIHSIRKVLTANDISLTDKTNFVRKNKTAITNVVKNELTGLEFKGLMGNRPLPKFRPLKNSFTKRGDKILLAKTLGIPVSEVDDFIVKAKDFMKTLNDLNFLPNNQLEAIKTYVYRHGSIDDVVSFLDYELKHSKNLIKTLYSTLEYHSGGVADYFIRPIHRMSNTTMIKLYNIIDENLELARSTGTVSDEQYDEIARHALVKIYQIQNNSKFINAVKTYKVLNN